MNKYIRDYSVIRHMYSSSSSGDCSRSSSDDSSSKQIEMISPFSRSRIERNFMMNLQQLMKDDDTESRASDICCSEVNEHFLAEKRKFYFYGGTETQYTKLFSHKRRVKNMKSSQKGSSSLSESVQEAQIRAQFLRGKLEKWHSLALESEDSYDGDNEDNLPEMLGHLQVSECGV